MTKLGNRFSIVRSRLDGYTAPKGTGSSATSVPAFDLSNDYYQNIKGSYAPNGSINVPFTARPMVNLIQANTISDFNNSFKAEPVRDTFHGRPIYRSSENFRAVFYSNSIYNNPLLKNAYLNFFVKNGDGVTITVTLYFGSSQRKASYYTKSESIKIPLYNNRVRLVNIPLSRFSSYKSNFDYMQIHIDNVTDYSNNADILLETYCYSLTLIAPENVNDISDYLKVGI